MVTTFWGIKRISVEREREREREKETFSLFCRKRVKRFYENKREKEGREEGERKDQQTLIWLPALYASLRCVRSWPVFRSGRRAHSYSEALPGRS